MWTPDALPPGVELRLLAAQHASAMAQLQDEAGGDLLFPVSGDEIRSMLGPGGQSLGLFMQQRLIAFLGVTLPGRSEANLAHDIEAGRCDLDAVAHWTVVVVHAQFRGRGLARDLIAAAPDAPGLQGARWWFATARCENLASARSFLDAGARIVRIAPKYDGRLRYLFMRERGATAPRYLEIETVAAADIARQCALLQAGFEGFAKGERKDELRYGR